MKGERSGDERPKSGNEAALPAAPGSENVMRPVSGVGPCPHCGETHRYYYHAQEPCDDCIEEWLSDSQNDKLTRGADNKDTKGNQS